MNDEEEKRLINKFEINARPADLVPYIIARRQLDMMELVHKDLDKIRKEIVQLRADVKQESNNRKDDGK
jgi:hypothetical protein